MKNTLLNFGDVTKQEKLEEDLKYSGGLPEKFRVLSNDEIVNIRSEMRAIQKKEGLPYHRDLTTTEENQIYLNPFIQFAKPTDSEIPVRVGFPKEYIPEQVKKRADDKNELKRLCEKYGFPIPTSTKTKEGGKRNATRKIKKSSF